jgi:hypothetical protein
MTFHGSLQSLQSLVNQLGIPCHWEHKGQFELCVFEDGRSNLRLNWWPGSGELQLVGDPEVRPEVLRRLSLLLEGGAAAP